MDEQKIKQIKSIVSSLTVSHKELLSTYQEGYIGKKVYQVTLEDGSKRKVEQITKNKGNGDAVVIVPITEDGNFVMIIESRPNTKSTVALEFPAGMIDEGENPEESAKRELLEETGYEATSIYELESHYQDQGCSKALIHTYIALDCKKIQDKRLSGGERLEYIEMSYDEILSALRKEVSLGTEINDANTKIAFMEYTLKKRGIL